MRFTEIISEAGSPAQQAAIAIAMKKAGKKPKGVAEGLPQTLRKVVPGYAKREIDKKMDAGKFGKTDADKDANFQRYKKIQDKIKEQGVAEDRENFNGINLLLQKDDEEVFVKASAGSRELGHVLFVMDGDYLMPQDLEVEERYRGQGIAQTMYDFVKSKGYKIRRSGQQTDAGAGFWAKHRPEQNVWEEGVAEAIRPDVMRHQGDKTIKIVKRAGKPIGEIGIDAEASSGIGSYYVKMYDGSYDAVGFDTAEEALAELKDIIKQTMAEGENWSKHNNKRAGGMSKKSVSVYRREHPGSKIQTAVTTKPSKLKKGSKAAKRRASFCARMRGMKKHRTSAKTAHDPNSNINKSLRRWHCESIEELHELVMLAEQFIRNNKK